MANYYIALHCLDLCFHYFYLLRIDGIKVSCNCIARKLRARRPAHFNLRISIRGRFGVRRARGAAPVGDAATSAQVLRDLASHHQRARSHFLGLAY
jgi:hypothetical protein